MEVVRVERVSRRGDKAKRGINSEANFLVVFL